MNRSFFTTNVDSVLASGSENFSAKISASAAEYGLSPSQAEAYAALNATWQEAYLAAIAPGTRTKSSVAAKNSARIPLRKMASDLAKVIAGNGMVSDAQRIELGLAVKPTRGPRPAPGMPYSFNAELGSEGSLTLTWKCDNPRGASGTMYQVWRRIGPTGDFEFLGGSGAKRFFDPTVPAGSPQVTYQVRAVRSTAVGAAAQYIVHFGSTADGPMTTAMPMRAAA